MKKINLLLFLILSSLNCLAQKYQLQITGQTIAETKIIDSLNYLNKHVDSKTVIEEITKTQNLLVKKGFLEATLIYNVKINDSSYIAKFEIGDKTTSVLLITSLNQKLKKIIEIPKDTTLIPYSNLELFLNEKKNKLTAAGYPLAIVQLSNITKNKTFLIANLDIVENQQKRINTIIVAKNDKANFKFPQGHLNQITKKFRDTPLTEYSLNKINEEFNKFTFTKQTKYPETLFTKDSTKIYVYLEKQNANSFDGFIGFNSNEKQKLTLSGYLDLQLVNILNAGEEFKLNWKSNGNNQTTFNSSLEIPYVLNSPIGLKGQINIFKQDSTFQNSRASLEASYFIRYNTRIYFGRESTSSSDIQNVNNGNISDFKSAFFTATFSYNKRDLDNFMNPNKTNINLKLGMGRRENTNALSSDNSSKQNYIELNSNHTLYFSKKNHFNIKGIFFNLNSKDYGTNELYRFGGITSIRGFQENSLQAKTYLVVATEYRYLFNSNFYINTVADYGYYNLPFTTTSNNFNKNLLSTGLGVGLLTKNGLFKISAVKNYNKEEKTNIYNTLIHISYSITF